MGAAALADVERLAPVLERKGAGDRYGEPALGGQPGEFGQHVPAHDRPVRSCTGLSQADANAQFRGVCEIATGDDPFRIAARDLDQVGQYAARTGDAGVHIGRRGVEDQVRRAASESANPLHHAVAIGGHLGAEGGQLFGMGLAGGGDHPGAAQQGDLDGGEADHRARAVDEQRLAGLHIKPGEVAKRRLHRHRQGGGQDHVETGRRRRPVVQDRIVGRAGARVARIVRRAQHPVADADIRHAFADCVHGPGHVQPDPAWQLGGEQAPAQSPVRRVEPAGLHLDPNAARARRRNLGVLKAQHIGRFAVAMEADRSHGAISTLRQSLTYKRRDSH